MLNHSGTKAFDYDDIKSLVLRFQSEEATVLLLTTKGNGLEVRFDEFEEPESAVDFLLNAVDQINEYCKGR